MKLMFATILSACLFCAACDRTPAIPEPIDPIGIDSVQGPFKLKWQFWLNDQHEQMFCTNPLLIGSNILFSRMFAASDGLLTFRDGKTGDLVWNWDSPTNAGADHEAFNVSPNGVAVRSGDVFSIDIASGTTNWEYDEDDYGGGCQTPKIAIHGNYIYATQDDCGFSGRVSRVIRSPIGTLAMDTIATIVCSPELVAGADPPIVYPTADGDTLIIFQNRGDTTDLYAFSLNTRQQVWRQHHVDPFGVGNIFPMMIANDKLYYVGSFHALCLDPLTGEILWHTAMGLLNVRCVEETPLVTDGKVLVKSDMTGLLCLNAETGSVMWQNNAEGSAAPSGRVVRYKEYVMYIGGLGNAVYVHRLSDGELVYKLQTPNLKLDDDCTMRGLAVDEEAGLLYTTDGFFAQCYEINL